MKTKRDSRASSNRHSRTTHLLELAANLRDELIQVDFSEAVPWVYHPLSYAWEAHAEYLRKYGSGTKRVLFLGMNPGPWGMMQTGIPFGEIAAVRDFLQIGSSIGSPEQFHPKRPIQGWNCKRSEVSGKRFWGFVRDRFRDADRFFEDHFVANYCPVAFLEASGRNVTPDKLPSALRAVVDQLCMKYLEQLISEMQPEWVVGVGAFATERIEQVQANMIGAVEFPPSEFVASKRSVAFQVATILHPSPASPLANRDWQGTVVKQLVGQGVWKSRISKFEV